MALEPRPACGKRGSEVRSMWTFGLQGVEYRLAVACMRPAGHRGDCRHRPYKPEAPLLPVPTRYVDQSGAVRYYPMRVSFGEVTIQKRAEPCS